MNHSQTQSAPLLEMPSGCKLTVEELYGDPSTRSRLYAMGILPGTEMEVCRQACGNGSVCVRVRQCSLVLGQNMAEAIFCRPEEGHGHHGRHKWWARSHGPERGCGCPEHGQSAHGHTHGHIHGHGPGRGTGFGPGQAVKDGCCLNLQQDCPVPEQDAAACCSSAGKGKGPLQ